MKCSWNTHICGTLHLDKGVTKEIKEKLKYLKKGQTTYCRKGQVLVNVWRDKRDVRLISALHNRLWRQRRTGGMKQWRSQKQFKIITICKVCIGQPNLQYWPRCTKTVKWTKKSVLLLLHMATLNSLILSKKYTTNEIQKRKCYASKDLILDCVWKNDGTRRGRRREW